jgi:hypothetical protein
VNGEPVAVEAIVERVRRIHAALADFRQLTVDRIDDGTRTALLLSQSGVHVGPLPTPLGTLAPTGRLLTRRLVEFITHDHQRLVEVTGVADDLDRLRQTGVVAPLV